MIDASMGYLYTKFYRDRRVSYSFAILMADG